jgi:hypothetical protein
MLWFRSAEYQVKARIERVIVEKTGELRQLSNCFVLYGVTATGEYRGFNREKTSHPGVSVELPDDRSCVNDDIWCSVKRPW